MTVLVDRFQRNIIHTFNKLNNGIPTNMLKSYHKYMKALSLNKWDPVMASVFLKENGEMTDKIATKAPFDHIDKFIALLELLELEPCDDLPEEELREAFYILREDGFRNPERKIISPDWVLSLPEKTAKATLDHG